MRPEIEKKIAENPDPLKVNLVGMKLFDDELLDVMKTIKKYKPMMTVLDLDNNKISNQGAVILSQQLRDFDNIKEISLQYNSIGKEGAIELFSLKKTFVDLDILFHGNQITDVGDMDEIERIALAKYPEL